MTLVAFVLGGCALQPAYVSPSVPAPERWSTDTPATVGQVPLAVDGWWRRLYDPAIDALAAAAFADSPTLAKAVARIDEARATLAVDTAAGVPNVGASAGITRAKSQNTSGLGAGTTTLSTAGSAGPSLSWEIDLFGRVRETVAGAQSRLDARTADAEQTRLALAADVANGVLSLRACEDALRVDRVDITSREKTLDLTRLRFKAGFAAPVDVARELSGLASARTGLATQSEQCARQINALVALTGQDARSVRRQIGLVDDNASDTPLFMPQAPASAPELPATVLARHPNVVAAERDTAAAWSDIGVARAERLPRLDLLAALTGQWIRAAGSTLDFTTWSFGPSLSATLFDGGAGAANVRAAQARYRTAEAVLRQTLRSTVQDVEDALAAQASALTRLDTTAQNVAAARTTLEASEAQWKAGAISQFELQDSRRQFVSAQDAHIAARRDQAQAWIALVKATGGALTLTPEVPAHD